MSAAVIKVSPSILLKLDLCLFVCFSQVLLKLFTFLINTADKEIYNLNNHTWVNFRNKKKTYLPHPLKIHMKNQISVILSVAVI